MAAINYAVDVKDPKSFISSGYARVIPSEYIMTGKVSGEADVRIDRVGIKINESLNGRPSFLIYGSVMGMTGKFPFNVSKVMFKDPKFLVMNFEFSNEELAESIMKGLMSPGYDLNEFKKALEGNFIKYPLMECDVLAVDGLKDKDQIPVPVIFASPKVSLMEFTDSYSSGYRLDKYLPDKSDVLGKGFPIQNSVDFGIHMRPELNIETQAIRTEIHTKSDERDIVHIEEKTSERKAFNPEEFEDVHGNDLDFNVGDEIILDDEKTKEELQEPVSEGLQEEIKEEVKEEVKEESKEEMVAEPVKEAMRVNELQLLKEELAAKQKLIEEEEARLKAEAARLEKAQTHFADASNIAVKTDEEIAAEAADDAMRAIREGVTPESLAKDAFDYDMVKEVEPLPDVNINIDTSPEPVAPELPEEEAFAGNNEKYDVEDITDKLRTEREKLEEELSADTTRIDVKAVEQNIKEEGVGKALKKFNTSEIPTGSDFDDIYKGLIDNDFGNLSDYDVPDL